MLLADHAHEDGTAAWRSVGSMASTLDVSERTIKRALADLKLELLIEPGDQRLTMHLPANKRPTVYNLKMRTPIAAQVELFAGVTDVSPVTTVVQPSKEEPSLNTSKTSRGNHTGDVTPERCRSHRSGVHLFVESSGYCACGQRDDGARYDIRRGVMVS